MNFKLSAHASYPIETRKLKTMRKCGKAITVHPVRIPADTYSEVLLIFRSMLPFASVVWARTSGPRETTLCVDSVSVSASLRSSRRRRAATSCLSGGCSWRCTSVVVAKPTLPRDSAERCERNTRESRDTLARTTTLF